MQCTSYNIPVYVQGVDALAPDYSGANISVIPLNLMKRIKDVKSAIDDMKLNNTIDFELVVNG